MTRSRSKSGDQFDLHPLQKTSGEFCHLNALIVGNSITTGSWDEDGFGFQGKAYCHFQLRTSDWECRGSAPEVWILGINVNGSFTDGSQNRIRGIMEVKYDHRSGRGSYTTAMIRKLFDVVKTSP